MNDERCRIGDCVEHPERIAVRSLKPDRAANAGWGDRRRREKRRAGNQTEQRLCRAWRTAKRLRLAEHRNTASRTRRAGRRADMKAMRGTHDARENERCSFSVRSRHEKTDKRGARAGRIPVTFAEFALSGGVSQSCDQKPPPGRPSRRSGVCKHAPCVMTGCCMARNAYYMYAVQSIFLQ